MMEGGSPAKVKTINEFDGQFDTLIPFDQYLTPEIPAELLPPIIGNYAKDLAKILCVPQALPTMAALGMISTAVCKKFVVSPKGDWEEDINIYVAIALPPGSIKSLITKKMLAPVEKWEKSEILRVQPTRDDKIADKKVSTLKLKKIEKIISGKKKPDEDQEAVEKEYKELLAQVSEIEESIPAIPKIYANNVTPEALEQYLHEQNGRFAIISDEGGVLETLSGLYSNGRANVDIILKGIDGGTIRVKRQGREYDLRPYLTLLLIVQPQVLIDMSDKRSFTGNGALERYLYALPVPNIGYRTITEEVLDDFDEQQFSNTIYNLLCIKMPEKPYKITLSVPARKIWNTFRNEIEKEMRPDGKLYICRGWGAKLAGYTLRIAGLLHVAQHVNIQNLIIEEKTMETAIRFVKLLSEHAVAAFGLMALDQETQDAKELFELLKAMRRKMLTKTEIVNTVRNRKMGKKERLSKAINALGDRNILSEPYYDVRTKKPTECYFINPDIYS